MNTEQLRSLLTLLDDGQPPPPESHPYQVGKSYLIRTVTHYYLGRLDAVYPQELVLSSAGWVTDTGRYHERLATGKLDEFEPCAGEPLIIGRGAIVDAATWNHRIPLETI